MGKQKVKITDENGRYSTSVTKQKIQEKNVLQRTFLQMGLQQCAEGAVGARTDRKEVNVLTQIAVCL